MDFFPFAYLVFLRFNYLRLVGVYFTVAVHDTRGKNRVHGACAHSHQPYADKGIKFFRKRSMRRKLGHAYPHVECVVREDLDHYEGDLEGEQPPRLIPPCQRFLPSLHRHVGKLEDVGELA